MLCSCKAGPILASPLRKHIQNPRRIIGPYVSNGMTVMDIGCGMGFFTIPMSIIVGKQGRVIAVDLQPEMLAGLKKNAQKAGCANIMLHQCYFDSLDIGQWDESVDFMLLFMMLHEVPDAKHLIREVYNSLTPKGKLLFAEPIVHVSYKKYQKSMSMILKSGFKIVGSPKIPLCRSAVFQKANIKL